MTPKAATRKILLVDHQPVVRAGCRAILAKQGRTFFQAASLEEAQRNIIAGCPDLAIVADEPAGLSVEIISAILEQAPALPLIFFADDFSPLLAAQAIERGAKAVLQKTATPDALRQAVDAVLDGKSWLDQGLAHQIAFLRIKGPQSTPLSPRESQVLRLLASGSNYDEIANQLGLSSRTVAFHKLSLTKKLQARTTVGLVQVARKLNLI